MRAKRNRVLSGIPTRLRLGRTKVEWPADHDQIQTNSIIQLAGKSFRRPWPAQADSGLKLSQQNLQSGGVFGTQLLQCGSVLPLKHETQSVSH